MYITLAAEGDRTVLLSSGFDLAKTGERTPPITTPQNLTLTPGPNTGEVVAQVEGVKGAKAYIYEYTPNPITEESVWIPDTVTKRRYLFACLKAGDKYCIRVAAVGVRNQKMYSSVITIMSHS